MTYNPQKRKVFYNALHVEHALDFSKPEDREKYVEGLHGNKDAVLLLKEAIEVGIGQGVYLFSGQTSSGKSTELRRLQYLLENNPDESCKVFYLDMSDWLNPERPIELGSFLVAVVSAWVDAIGRNDHERTIAQRLWALFTKTNIEITGGSVGTDIAGIKTNLQYALQYNDDFLESLRTTVNKGRDSFVNQVQAFVQDVVSKVCPHNEKCVLLIDSLEKIQGSSSKQDEVMDSVKNMFSQHGRALQLPLVHAVYSIAPYVLEQNRQLPGLLGGAVSVQLPSVHIFQRKSTALDPSGVEKMLQLLTKRFAEWGLFFTQEQVEKIIENTGGDLRDFQRALKVCLLDLDVSQPQVGDQSLEFAWSQIHPTLVLESKYLDWLGRVAQSHEAELNNGIDAHVLQRFLNTKHVLAYLNGETWYGIHPLIRKAIKKHVAKQARDSDGTNSAAQ